MKPIPFAIVWSVLTLCMTLTGASHAAPAADSPSAKVDDSKLPGAGPFTSRPPYQAAHVSTYAKRNQVDQRTVVFLGDSITEFWSDLGNAFRPLRVANRGIASDTTRGMLCRLKETVLDTDPQAVVLLGGINDLRDTNHPPGTPATVSGNIRLILAELHKMDPKMPVLICEILPSAIGTPERIKSVNEAVDQVVAEFPNAVRVKTNALFLNPDGTQNKALFSDGIHLKPEGYAVWRKAMATEFAKLELKRINIAVTPATQKGNGYDWMARHEAAVKAKSELNPDLVFIGDSITHAWGGLPDDGTPSRKIGEKVMQSAFAGHRILNLGFGSDRTQQVLWRLDHGELAGLKPRWVVVNIGTNNTSDGQSAGEVMSGIAAVCERVKKQTPAAKIILMSVFPRDEKAASSRRKLIDEINLKITDYAKVNQMSHLDIGGKFLDANGSISRALMPDFCHPVEQGYQFWADALLPLLK